MPSLAQSSRCPFGAFPQKNRIHIPAAKVQKQAAAFAQMPDETAIA
jgi:hypothetical protein